MKNLAGVETCDADIEEELRTACIDIVRHDRRSRNEVPASITGELKFGAFVFTRYWYYWVVCGDVSLRLSRQMYMKEARRGDVRVAGHCECPPPDDWAEPSLSEIRRLCDEKEYDYEFLKDMRYVKVYHIDSQEGLNFFVRCVTTGKVE